MKLFFAIKTLQVKGGAERVFADLVSALADRGHDVVIATFDHAGERSVYPLGDGVKKVFLGIGEVVEKTGIGTFFMRLPMLRKCVRIEEPDVVVGFTHAMYVPLSLAMVGLKIPLLASEHIVPAYYEHRRIEFLLLRISAYLVDRFSVLSHQIGDLYPSAIQSKLVVIPNSVAPAKAFANPKGEGKKTKVILNVGRLVDFKDQQTLISAFSLIAADHPNWNLRIIGDGELRDDLEQQVVSKGLQNRICLPGNSDEIINEYVNAHLFVVSSIYEGFGLVTAEAASHQLPVIGFSDCPGTNELIEHDVTGLLVNPDNRVTNLAAGLHELIDNDELRLRMGIAGKKKMVGYAPENVYEQWEAVLYSMRKLA